MFLFFEIIQGGSIERRRRRKMKWSELDQIVCFCSFNMEKNTSDDGMISVEIHGSFTRKNANFSFVCSLVCWYSCSFSLYSTTRLCYRISIRISFHYINTSLLGINMMIYDTLSIKKNEYELAINEGTKLTYDTFLVHIINPL